MKKIMYVIVLFISTLFIISCTQKDLKTSNKLDENIKTNTESIEGMITVVGNEPFTRLALLVNDSTTYVLDCDSLIKSDLLNNQGKTYKIEYSVKEKLNQGIALKVTKINPIIKNDK
ncbi:MAG: hypothetical protein JEY94_03090 [Melioribacteraceae bacterium]|nr:hypothetical protein [Melioribacteraceae bacterium]